eukprot:jgi/Ulvmu1/11543/UM078_0033.1
MTDCSMLQELVLSAGHVVDLPASDYVSTISGEQGRSSHKKDSSTTDAPERPSGGEDETSLMWKVQVSDLQAAFLSTSRLGTAQFVADDCTVSQSRMHSSVRIEANASNAALYIMRHDVDLDNPICWLQKGPAGYTIPNLDQMVNPVRMVLQPFQLNFCSHTALARNEAAHAPGAPVEYLQMNLDMKSLHAQTSSYEYDVLVDVISGLLISPLPEPEVMRRHVPVSPVDTDESLAELKAAVKPARQAMRSRQHALATLTTYAPSADLPLLPQPPHGSFAIPVHPSMPDLFTSTPSTDTSSRNHSPVKTARPVPHAAAVPSLLPSLTHAGTLHPRASTAASDAATGINPLLCPLRASVVTMTTGRVPATGAQRDSPADSATTVVDADTTPAPAVDGPWLRASPATSPGGIGGASGSPGTGTGTDSVRSVTDCCTSLRVAGVQSATTSPEPGAAPQQPLHRKAISMGAVALAGIAGAGLHRSFAVDSLNQSCRDGGGGRQHESLEAEASAAPSSGQLPLRGASPLKTGHRLRSQLEAGGAALASFRVRSMPRGSLHRGSMPSVSTTETATLAEEDECELEAKHRLLQMSLQFNQVKDYLSKGDAEVFTKCIIPFLKVDKHLEAGEIEAASLAPLLESCLANWLENQTTTQEMVLDSLEDAIDKERVVLEEALIRRRRAEDLSHSVHLRIAIGSLAWVLSKPDGQPMMSVDATGIQFSRTHHKDRTGFCKTEVKDLTVKDQSMSLAISKQLPKGVMLTKHKDPAWRKEGFLLVNVIRGRPTAEEVVYNHIDIKLHPITLQLDAAALAALTAFFKVRGASAGADRDGRRLDRAMGISAIARAEKWHRRHQARTESLDDVPASASAPGPLGISAAYSLVSTPSCSTVTTTGSHTASLSSHAGPFPASSAAASCGGAYPEATAPLPLPAAGGAMEREARPNAAAAARVVVEPRAHHYKTVVFAPTTVCVSLRVDNMKFARCSDKVIRVPDYRYEDMHGARPAALLSRCAPVAISAGQATATSGWGHPHAVDHHAVANASHAAHDHGDPRPVANLSLPHACNLQWSRIDW